MSKKVKIYTTIGEIVFELYTKHCPKTCENFLKHCKSGYYNNCTFFRVIPGFMIQSGDPTNTGLGGESASGGLLKDEIMKELRHTGAGILCMANQGKKDTNGSQFFVTLSPQPKLDGKDTVFGRVFSGMKTIRLIGLTKVDNRNRPIKDITIVKTEVL